MNFALALLMMTTQIAQPQACDNACLAAAVQQLQATVEKQNEFLAKLLEPPPPPKHPKLALALKVGNQLATFAVPLMIKAYQSKTTVVTSPAPARR